MEKTMTANTNIMDKNHLSLVEWFEATPEYDKLHQLDVPATVIDTIEGDLALYVDDNYLDDFNDIPQGEIIVAIADNTDTQTRLHVLWEYEDAELDGNIDGVSEPIDRDQAVDDDGKAVFDRYSLNVDTAAPDDTVPDWQDYEFTVEDIEAFAETW